MTLECIGHRGARGLFPENTREGIRAAAALGIRTFEIDVAVTKDDQVVLHHDLALNPDIARLGDRWPAGSLPLIRAMPYDELQDIDVGRICPNTPTAAAFPHQQPIDGARIPRLADILALDPALTWFIELKLLPDRPTWTIPPEEMVERVIECVEAAGAASRVTLQSFDWRAPRHAHTIRPAIARAWLTSPRTEADPALWWDLPSPPSAPRAIAAEGGGTWTPHYASLSPARIAEAHALGLQVVPWTVNAQPDIDALHAAGIERLITDYPVPHPSGQGADPHRPSIGT